MTIRRELPSSNAGPVAVAIVDGELDLASGRYLESALAELADAKGLFIDLTSVTFVDLSGLAALSAAVRALGAGDHAVRIVPSPAVGRLLKLLEDIGRPTCLRTAEGCPAAVDAVAVISLPPGTEAGSPRRKGESAHADAHPDRCQGRSDAAQDGRLRRPGAIREPSRGER